MATRFAIVDSQAPRGRLGSYDEAARQAWTNVCWVASSASPVSPSTLNAIAKTSRP